MSECVAWCGMVGGWGGEWGRWCCAAGVGEEFWVYCVVRQRECLLRSLGMLVLTSGGSGAVLGYGVVRLGRCLFRSLGMLVLISGGLGAVLGLVRCPAA